MSTKRTGLILAVLFAGTSIYGEDITLEQVERAVIQHHPLAEQLPLIDQLAKARIDLANLKYLPKVSASTRATRQSETTTSPLATEKPDLSQWQLTTDVSLTLFDGGAIEAQKKAVAAESAVTRNQTKVGLASIRSQVRQAYLTIILMDTQISQIRLLAKDLSDNRARLTAQLANGVGIRSDIEAIQVEELNTKAKEVELLTRREGALIAMSEASGLTLTESTRFVRPDIKRVADTEISLDRTEFQVYDSQKMATSAERQSLLAGLLPQISTFAQVGYSKPGLNAFSPDPSPWWVVGVQATVALDNLYGYDATTRKIEAEEKRIAADRAQFVLTEGFKLQQKLAEIRRLEEAIAIDKQIIVLRQSIKAAAEAKSANGVISIADLVREINEENLAEEAKAEHEIQLLLAQSEWNEIIGKGESQS